MTRSVVRITKSATAFTRAESGVRCAEAPDTFAGTEMRCIASVIKLLQAALLAEIHDYDNQRDEEQHDRDRAAIPHAIFLKRLVVHHHGEVVRRVKRPAARHHVQNVETLERV